jgi:UDP-N-acetylglucosamine transferase subunit ALG13
MSSPKSDRMLLVGSTGGHLEELARLRPRLTPKPADVEWVTFDTEQARHVLRGEIVHYVPMVKPRDVMAAARTWLPAQRILSAGRFDRIVSTGAAVALPFLVQARLRGMSAHYIESAARSEGPSLTGRLLRAVPGIHLYSQYPTWSTERWQFRGSVFDGFAPGSPRQLGAIDRVVVTLGTQRDYGFERAVRALVGVLKDVCTLSATVLWQTGSTNVNGLPIRGHETVPAAELVQAIAEADLVIGHAGVGTALTSLEAGRHPVLLPRLREHGEHTDDHQLQIAAELQRRGLALAQPPDKITAAALAEAARATVVAVADPPVLDLRRSTRAPIAV